ncbi:sensor domain-containing diguanylate cyclase [Chromatocurvus halotolerans]|uniref:Diguanylate cyclase with GAF sensor n=1 Tax=Chromatocurvus halotolerans TaxID=1132028 RepID=A0A4R2KN76_9GAMM|nr:sensor domain-containing diguanylate cyclase [Chromatocurvus halotolerans]TCO75601.1 diguanylate cyclase with GAF sensor [Chromatocurvus halotolerans]
MQEPKIPDNETQRLATLHALKILDSAPEERFDRLTRMARRMFGVPISLVSIVDSDRQWFKSSAGLDATETPRAVSFCGHAILGDGVFTVEDATRDERFHDNPLVTGDPNVRFYAGCPLQVANGHKMGTLCLIDHEPRTLDDEDRLLLQDLAKMAEQEIAALQMATLDELTGISNRRGFMALAKHAVAMCRRHKEPAVLIVLDLDKFKPINDRFGHAEGDRALIAFSRIMQEVFRDSDVYARTGGDEFIVLLTGADEAGAKESLERFGEALSDYNRRELRGYDLEYSAGYVTRAADDDRGIEALIEAADDLMYARKKRKTRQGDQTA